ncbi:uncharacterized protein LOC120734797 isoform X1 [Simochromis diagramma]|uniref:uncharacterized protein LOC120734797 isoform X1 n=1 Tax=Simochromis diagramma TaxID=43689 RepID=UPI001A7EE1D3|nr:uncharacterized protein LOC120734797 isoform X1 [Simochromis diagramma]
MNIKTLKGHHHEDGTQSDSEDPVLKRRSKSHHSVRTEHSMQSELSQASQQVIQSGQSIHSQLHQPLQYAPPRPASASPVAPERPLSQSPPKALSPTEFPKQAPPEHLTQQAFIIEFFDDNPRKKRSQSFTHNPAHADSYSTLRAKLERRKGGERPASVHGHIPPTQQVTVPLKSQSHGGPQRSSSLKREKTEGEAASSASSSRSSSGIIIRMLYDNDVTVVFLPITHMWHTRTTHLQHLAKTSTMMTISELKTETSVWLNIHYMYVVQCWERNDINLSDGGIVDRPKGYTVFIGLHQRRRRRMRRGSN